MQNVDNYLAVAFGCGCHARGAHPWETYDHALPELKGVLYRVNVFTTVCEKHRLTIVKTLRQKGRRGPEVFRRGGAIALETKGNSRFWACSGEALAEHEVRDIEAAVRQVTEVRKNAQRHVARAEALKIEDWLISKGWISDDGGDTWTASEELRAARADRGVFRYVGTTLQHAVNTQRLLDGGIPRAEQREQLKQQAWDHAIEKLQIELKFEMRRDYLQCLESALGRAIRLLDRPESRDAPLEHAEVRDLERLRDVLRARHKAEEGPPPAPTPPTLGERIFPQA